LEPNGTLQVGKDPFVEIASRVHREQLRKVDRRIRSSWQVSGLAKLVLAIFNSKT
jgi:hypothetical protein